MDDYPTFSRLPYLSIEQIVTSPAWNAAVKDCKELGYVDSWIYSDKCILQPFHLFSQGFNNTTLAAYITANR